MRRLEGEGRAFKGGGLGDCKVEKLGIGFLGKPVLGFVNLGNEDS